jgi:hypothetical protein
MPTGGRLVLLIVVTVAVIAAVLDVTLSTGGGSTTTVSATSPSPAATVSPTPQQVAAQSWQRTAQADEEPAVQAYIGMVEDAENWQKGLHQNGKVSAAGLRADLVGVLHSYRDARASLAKQASYGPAPQALTDFRQSVALYSESAQLTRAATFVAPGPLRAQALLGVSRLRHLGDDVYDQANDSLKPFLPPPARTPNLHFDPTPQVPDWAAIAASSSCVLKAGCPSLAAGPPLEPSAPALATSPSPATTAQPQSLAGWQSGVRSAGIPSAGAEVNAIIGHSAATARAITDQFAAAQLAIARLAAPAARPTLSPTLQLDLLIHAEAVRSAEQADLVKAGGARAALLRVAKSVASTGDALWDSSLGGRSTKLT